MLFLLQRCCLLSRSGDSYWPVLRGFPWWETASPVLHNVTGMLHLHCSFSLEIKCCFYLDHIGYTCIVPLNARLADGSM